MKKLIIVAMLLVSSVCYASTNYDISGTWKGYLNADEGYAKVTMELEQYEDGTFVGSWKASSGGRGTVGGKLKGRTLKFKMTSQCSGRYSGRGSLSKNGMQIKYTLSGSNECDGDLNGSGKVYYQE
jgi:hypothetical protein